MELTHRRVLYLSFITVFVLGGAFLLLYLQGYRYNPSKGKVERTGAVAAETEPQGATLVLNGTVQQRPTPVTAQPLPPGDYDVVLQKTGYQTWHKRLPVRPSEVTFTGPVRLWPTPQQGDRIAGTAVTTTELSPNGESLLYRSMGGLSSGLWILNLRSGDAALITRPARARVVATEWSPESRELLLTEESATGRTFRVYDLETSRSEALALPDSLEARAAHWGEDNHTVFVATDRELYEHSRRTGATKLVWRESLQDFRVHDGLVFGLARSGDGFSLELLNRRNLELVPFESPVALSTELSFLAPHGDWLPLYDQGRHTLLLLRSPLETNHYARKLPEVTAIDWAEGGNRLILTNNFEIWEYRLEEDKLNLLLRVSEPLAQARAYLNTPYLLYATGHKVWALELDNRDEQQRWLLGSYPSAVEDLFLDRLGEYANVKTVSGFYRFKLGEPTVADELRAGSPVRAIQRYLRQSTLP